MAPDKQPHDANDKSDFIPYPTNRVVGIIDDAGDVQGALCDLKSAGFGPDDIRLLTGEAGAHRIDIKGDEHGALAHVVRSVQEVLGSYEIEHLTRRTGIARRSFWDWSHRSRRRRPRGGLNVPGVKTTFRFVRRT